MISEMGRFKPSARFTEAARLGASEAERLARHAEKDFEGFWADLARSHLRWDQDFTSTLEWEPPFAKWFLGGKLNASAQCLDKNLKRLGDKPALIWQGETSARRVYTYRELHQEVCRFAHALKNLGAQPGDRVAIYLPMIPEAMVALLACARIGATHSVIFGGFSAEALRDRIQDAQARFVITANGGYRRGKVVPLKENVDQAVSQCPTVEKVIVVDRLNDKAKTSWTASRDFWYHELLSNSGKTDLPPTAVDSEHPLFILYTSGTTGKPKGIVHSTAGYLLWAKLTCEWVFDLKEDDIYWCTADIGWVTGHSYVVYGPLAAGATVVMYEGAPDYPTFHRFWKIIEKEKVTVFYTAPTAIRAFMRQGEEFPNDCDLSSLRLLGSVGEPINPEAWMWYHRVIGKNACPIVDTWWQTETGAIMISPLPGLTETKPGSATQPLPGIFAEVVDDQGNPVPPGTQGKLVLTRPWPSQLRTIHQDQERYKKQYWSEFPGKGHYYVTGDGAYRDKDGYFWIIGRIDDVINVAGHRLGTAEIEGALVANPQVAESAVVGKPDELKGTAICAFVTLKKEFRDKIADAASKERMISELKQTVAKEIGALARPDEIRFADALPKTRSGKIMRRLLRDIAAGRKTTGDTSTLEDLSVLATLKEYQDSE